MTTAIRTLSLLAAAAVAIVSVTHTVASATATPLTSIEQRSPQSALAGQPKVLADPDGLIAEYPAPTSGGAPVQVRADQLIVSFRSLEASVARARLESRPGVTVLRAIPRRAVFLVGLTPDERVVARDIATLTSALGLEPEIASGEVIVDAPFLFELGDNQTGIFRWEFEPWHFLNLGRTDAQTNDADIDAEEALGRLAAGGGPHSQPVRISTVAVIDSGVNPIHPSLASALWVNPGEIPGNGRDDDGNGYVDDIHGWNFEKNNNELQDPTGHGTHVAGIVAARRTTHFSPRGVTPMSQLVIAKVTLKAELRADAFPVLESVYYATDLKVDAINMSLKAPGHIQAFQDAIYEAHRAGIAVVAAAGNDGVDLATNPTYPCVYALIVVCVVATDPSDRLASFSNRNSALQLIAAPGVDIYSTFPDGQGDNSGTSMAAPLVAGALAGMRSFYPDMTLGELITRLYTTADQPKTLDGVVRESKRLNLYRAYFAPRQAYPEDGYCDERIPHPHSPGQSYPRFDNYPYANSGEPGIDGTSPGRAFTICTPRQLVSIAPQDLGRVFVLRRDIDWATMNPADRAQIGAEITTSGTLIRPFNGVLHGNGFVIRGLTFGGVRNTGGLFGELGPHALVTDLRLVDVDIAFRRNGGMLAPKSAGRIVNVQASGKVTGEMVVGGLVGQQIGGSIENSFVDAEVSGEHLVGGIVGVLGETVIQPGHPLAVGVITRSRFQGRIAGSRAGGIVGWANNGSVSESYAHVANPPLSADMTVGGLVGWLSCGARLEDSYAESRLNGRDEIGGAVGLVVSSQIRRTFAASFTSGGATGREGGVIGVRDDRRTNSIDSQPPLFLCTATTSPGPASIIDGVFYNHFFSQDAGGGGTALTDAQMRSRVAFPTYTSEIWRFEHERYPILKNLPRSTLPND